LLVKKDRGRPVDPKARPKAFGEVTVASDVPDAELLNENILSEGEGLDDESDFDTDDERDLPPNANKLSNPDDTEEEHEASEEDDVDEGHDTSDQDSDENGEGLEDDSDMGDDLDISAEGIDDDELDEVMNDSEDESSDQAEDSEEEDKSKGSGSKAQKRKLSDYIGQLNSADASLRALKRLAGAKKDEVFSGETDKILSNEDFKRIKELKVCDYEIHILTAFHYFIFFHTFTLVSCSN
jgi:protein SDA1